MNRGLQHCTGGGDQNHLKKKKCKKAKWLSEEALQIAEERTKVKGKREKERYSHLNAEPSEQQGEIRKPSSVISAKKQRKTIKWERLEISSRKLGILREHQYIWISNNIGIIINDSIGVLKLLVNPKFHSTVFFFFFFSFLFIAPTSQGQ